MDLKKGCTYDALISLASIVAYHNQEIKKTFRPILHVYSVQYCTGIK
jgi:hypothetical protein